MKIKCITLFIFIFFNCFINSNQMNSKFMDTAITQDNLTMDIEEKELNMYLKTFLIKLKDNQIDNNKLKERGVSGIRLKNLIKQYLKLKETKQNISKNTEQNIDQQNYSWMLRFKTRKDKNKKENNEDKENILIAESKNQNIINNTTTNHTYLPQPNIKSAIPTPLYKKETNSIFYSQILLDDNKEKHQFENKSGEDCIIIKEWEYKNHGDDWPCICRTGIFQSPINLEKKQAKQLIINSNIFFDFKFPELASNDEAFSAKLPLIRNLGTSLEIEIDCGILILPSHMNGYKCYKIQIHTPSEHIIESNSADMELQIYFKLKDKHIIDETTRDYLVLVILVKGIEEENYHEYIKETVKSHPFIDLLEVDMLPVSKGLARLLSNNLNFDLIFDRSKQPFKLLNSKIDYKNDDLLSKQNKVLHAINDFTYDKHYPLREYYLYNGSFTTPPCNENVTYVVVPEAILTKMEQIIVLKLLLNKIRIYLRLYYLPLPEI